MAEYRDPTPISPREPEYDKSKVSKEVANYTQQVREKKKGHDVREALARNSEIADIKAEDAVATSYDTKARQDDVENRFDDQIAGNTDIDEVIDARRPEGEEAYPTLRRRLDEEHQEVTAQLAQKPNQDEVRDVDVQMNVGGGLYIDTFDGSYQAYHPSVLYSPTPFPDNTNGFNYWMAYTPFPIGGGVYIDRWECPSIAVSSDGVTWSTPPGLKNPLVDLTQDQIENEAYFSDPDLIYHNNRFELWYRLTENPNHFQGTKIYRIVSSDGISWSEPELVLTGDDPENGLTGTDRIFRSMQVFVMDGVYRVYYGTQDEGLKYAESSNPSAGRWSNVNRLNLINDPGDSIWHLGMYKEDNTYHLLAYVSGKGVYYYKSTDGLNFQYQGISIQHNTNKYSGMKEMYQTVPVRVGNEWYVYASYKGEKQSFPRGSIHNIALLTGSDLMHLYPVDSGKIDHDMRINGDVLLVENKGTNYYRNQKNHLLFSLSPDATQKTGYSFDDGTPQIIRGTKYITVPSIRFGERTPSSSNVIPHYAGQMYVDESTKEMYYAVGSNSKDDFVKFVSDGGAIRLPATPEITIDNQKRVIINSGSENIESILGGSVGQEVVLINENANLTLKNRTGNLYLTGNSDKEMVRSDAIRLIYSGDRWYQN